MCGPAAAGSAMTKRKGVAYGPASTGGGALAAPTEPRGEAAGSAPRAGSPRYTPCGEAGGRVSAADEVGRTGDPGADMTTAPWLGDVGAVPPAPGLFMVVAASEDESPLVVTVAAVAASASST